MGSSFPGLYASISPIPSRRPCAQWKHSRHFTSSAKPLPIAVWWCEHHVSCIFIHTSMGTAHSSIRVWVQLIHPYEHGYSSFIHTSMDTAHSSIRAWVQLIPPMRSYRHLLAHISKSLQIETCVYNIRLFLSRSSRSMRVRRGEVAKG